MSCINLLSRYVLVIFKAFLTFDNKHTLLGSAMGSQLYQRYELSVKKSKWHKFFINVIGLIGSHLIYSRTRERESELRHENTNYVITKSAPSCHPVHSNPPLTHPFLV